MVLDPLKPGILPIERQVHILMKTISWRYASIFLVTISLMISMLILLVNAGKQVVQQKSDAVAQLNAYRPDEPEPGFVLRAYDGHLALWREGADKPYRILRSELWLLSDADRLTLEEGITVATETELLRLLEDLGAEE